MASNVGSTATITGNPQNMIIGSVSHIPYGAFAAALAPVAGAGLVLTVALIALFHRREFFTVERLAAAALPVRVHCGLMAKSVAVALAMVALFFAGQAVAKVAIVGGALLLLTRSVKAHKVYREIDWPLLVMFAGLFIVVGAQNAVLTPAILSEAKALRLGDTAPLSAVTAVLSNLVSNVRAVLVLKPFVEQLADWQRAWLVVGMASTLAGNFTLVGSIANLIVSERARREGVAIDFWPYFRVGAPLTVITIVLGAFWLSR